MSSPLLKKKEAGYSMPFGTRILPDDGVLFRLWAPGAKEVDLCLLPADGLVSPLPMTSHPEGWFVLHHPTAVKGDRYQFRIDNDLMVPDPASRCQADDVHGPSVVCDPNEFDWRDQNWTGRPWQETVIYELHVGTFSPNGTFAGVTERLDYLVQLGISAIELMPLAQFPGGRNWGYDGALLFAPDNSYGSPEDLKNLVQAAHDKGLMVFLDVVYNHFGPEGNYLYTYAKEAFFTEQFDTPWGAAIRFSGKGTRTVRDFYIANALYWLEEYHFDGLRFDAVHSIFDRSDPDIMEEIAVSVQQGPGLKRHVHLILENDNNSAQYLERQSDSQPRFFTAQWNDDIHHACHVLLTGETEGYYTDYCNNPINHLGRCLTKGFAYQGEISAYRQGQTRGEPSAHLSPLCFVSFLQNHDQIGNRAFGERLVSLTDLQDLKILTALILLAPSPPLLFMGEEFGATEPFNYFCDFEPGLAEQVTKGRRAEFAGFSNFSSPKKLKHIPDPNGEHTFMSSKINWSNIEKEENQEILKFYKILLNIRRQEIIPRLTAIKNGQAGYLIFSPKAMSAWWQIADSSRLTVVFNLQEEIVDTHVYAAASNLFFRIASDDQNPLASGCLPPKSIFWYLSEMEAIDV